jgi:hypothetical protein
VQGPEFKPQYYKKKKKKEKKEKKFCVLSEKHVLPLTKL